MKRGGEKSAGAHASKKGSGDPAPERGLRGWKAIAEHLAQPASTVQRWAKQGMPVRREGRSVVGDPAQLSDWLGKESCAAGAVTIAQPGEDLVEDLRRGLSAVRRRKRKAR